MLFLSPYGSRSNLFAFLLGKRLPKRRQSTSIEASPYVTERMFKELTCFNLPSKVRCKRWDFRLIRAWDSFMDYLGFLLRRSIKQTITLPQNILFCLHFDFSEHPTLLSKIEKKDTKKIGVKLFWGMKFIVRVGKIHRIYPLGQRNLIAFMMLLDSFYSVKDMLLRPKTIAFTISEKSYYWLSVSYRRWKIARFSK